MGGRRWSAGMFLAAAIGTAVHLTAIERTRLPQFALVAADGRVVTTSAIARPGKWIIVYVPPGCEGCAALLRHVAARAPGAAASLVIIVGSAPAEVVIAAARQFPELAAAAWFGDPVAAAIAPLRLGTAPAIFGLKGDMIEWSFAGVLAPSGELTGIIQNWIVVGLFQKNFHRERTQRATSRKSIEETISVSASRCLPIEHAAELDEPLGLKLPASDQDGGGAPQIFRPT
jgi:hypothetical protein